MKKLELKRLTLDELAEVMPVMRQEEQQECVGGVYYFINGSMQYWYNPEKGYYGNQEIYVYSGAVTYNYEGIPAVVYSSPPTYLGHATDSQKQDVMRYLANQLGINPNTVHIAYSSNPDYLGGVGNGQIYINGNHFSMMDNNINELMSTLIHENAHLNSSYSGDYDEYLALLAQSNSGVFIGCTQYYRDQILSELNRLRIKLGL
jgi:hypothetical protein